MEAFVAETTAEELSLLSESFGTQAVRLIARYPRYAGAIVRKALTSEAEQALKSEVTNNIEYVVNQGNLATETSIADTYQPIREASSKAKTLVGAIAATLIGGALVGGFISSSGRDPASIVTSSPNSFPQYYFPYNSVVEEEWYPRTRRGRRTRRRRR